MKRILFSLLILFSLFSSSALAVVQQGSMKIFAVTTEGTGLGADLFLIIEPGSGKIWSSITPLVGTTTQNAERTALDVAKIYSKDTGKYDYKFEIQSNASTVEGPSAGAAMTLLLVSMLRDRRVPNDVSITGTIASDGSVGAVGGVFEKAQEASNQGIKLFLVPRGEAKQIVKLPSGVQSVNLIEYAASQWGLKIVEVENMDAVLKLAYADIGAIDVNKNVDENIFDFLPAPIKHAESLALMRTITEKYIDDAKQQIEKSKKALNSSMLEDNELVQLLLGSLNNSEETVNEAELLLDQNFLYSAANYAFLAKVNAMLVQDVAENPSLLSLSSTLFYSKLQDLKKNIGELESQLNEYIPLDYFEWHIAAQQRAVYAENNVESLLSSQTIVVSTEDGTTDYSAVLERIQDYEFAVAWYGIALDFFSESSKSVRKIKPDNAFKDSVDPLLVQVENGLAVLPKEENEEIVRRYDAAVREKQLGWDLAAGFDAASAIALINASNQVKDSDLNKLYGLLVEKTQTLKKDIGDSKNPFVWANMYLDHTGYYLAGADYYIAHNREAKALDSVKSAISIAFLAENFYSVSNDYYAHYNNIPESKIIREKIESANGRQAGNMFTLVLAAGFAIGWILVIVLLVKFYQKRSRQKNHSVQEQINQVVKLQKLLDNDLASGKISNEQYYSLQAKYAERLNLLQNELKEKSEHIVEIDSLRAKLVGFEHVLRSLKAHYETGVILGEDYKRQVDLVQKEIDSIKAEIEEQQGELAVEEQQIKTQSVAELKKETQKIEKAGKRQTKNESLFERKQAEQPKKQKMPSQFLLDREQEIKQEKQAKPKAQKKPAQAKKAK